MWVQPAFPAFSLVSSQSICPLLTLSWASLCLCYIFFLNLSIWALLNPQHYLILSPEKKEKRKTSLHKYLLCLENYFTVGDFAQVFSSLISCLCSSSSPRASRINLHHRICHRNHDSEFYTGAQDQWPPGDFNTTHLSQHVLLGVAMYLLYYIPSKQRKLLVG